MQLHEKTKEHSPNFITLSCINSKKETGFGCFPSDFPVLGGPSGCGSDPIIIPAVASSVEVSRRKKARRERKRHPILNGNWRIVTGGKADKCSPGAGAFLVGRDNRVEHFHRDIESFNCSGVSDVKPVVNKSRFNWRIITGIIACNCYYLSIRVPNH